MPPIDTGQARTDLYGLGKGDAQVFDLDNATQQIMQNREHKFANDQAVAKQKDKRQEDVYKDMGDLNNVAIYAGHRPDFAEKQKQLTDYVEKNIQKLRAGDTDAFMQYQNLYSDIKTQAELSKNFREQKERMGLDILKDPEAYRDESLDYFDKTGRNEDGSMNFEIDPSKVKKNTDLVNDFRTNIRPIIEDMAKGKSYSYTDAQGNENSMDINSFDKKHATVLLEDSLKRPKIAEQAAYDYSKLPEDEQKKYNGYTDFYIQKMLPMALVDQNKTTVKNAEDKKYTYKDGSWNNDTYSWTYNKGRVAEGATPAPGFKEGDTYQEISLSNRKSEADNKPIAMTMANGETIVGVPKGIIKKDGWDKWEVAVEHIDPKTNKPVLDKNGKTKVAYVPVRNNTAKIQGEYGFNVDEAIKQIPQEKQKTASLADIKAKVGTKGYEGYTEEELIDYYKGLGYKIK